ncbi:MAG: hypothetical protein WCD69_29505, partial [Xanthobacteraceae bacterium]
INIDKSPRLHARVVAEVLAVVGNHKAPAKNGNAADAGTLEEQGGSRQNADNPAPPAHKPPAGTQLHTEQMIPN